MRKHIITAVLLMPLTCFATHHHNKVSLDGQYACSFNKPDQKEAIKCEKTLKQTGETYSDLTSCGDIFTNTGTGIYDKTTRRLASAFTNSKNPAQSGIAITEITLDGRLAITYAYLNTNTKGYGTCKKVLQK